MKKSESQNVEYKRIWRDDYLRWICGYANAEGGIIWLGIEDDKAVYGIENTKKLMEDIPNKIRDTMGIVADVALLHKEGKDVIRIKVKKSVLPVCYHGEYHYRTGSVKMQLTGSALTEFLLSKCGQDWDASPTFGGYKKDRYAFSTLSARYLKERKIKLEDADFESFGLAFADGRLTNAGVLFADDCPLYHSRVFCTRWNGCDMAAGVMDAKDNQEYSGGILAILKYAEDFVRVNSRHAWHKLARSRVEFVEYPERAVHEALVNAFIHRDYLVTGSEVHVDMFDDRLEITSPGGMPGERKIEDFDVHNIPSIRRNPLLADMCERLRIMERRGSGFKKIFEDYSKIYANLGNRLPILESHEAYFRITFPNLLYGFRDEQLISMTQVATPVGQANKTLLDDVQDRECDVQGINDDRQKGNIGSEKGNIGSEKGNIGSEKGNIDGLSSITQANIALLRDTYADRDMFKRADVLKVLPLNLASLSKLLRKMLDRGIIEPIQGRGKGAYRFVNNNHKV